MALRKEGFAKIWREIPSATGRGEVMLPFLAPLAFVVFVVLPAIVVTLWGRDT